MSGHLVQVAAGCHAQDGAVRSCVLCCFIPVELSPVYLTSFSIFPPPSVPGFSDIF
jgi:hypothetical protein